VKATAAQSAWLLLTTAAVVALTGCGKRANPMPPLQRIPAAPTDLAVTRIDEDVYVRYGVPDANVDGVRPADIARVDLYAITLDRDPQTLTDVDPEDLRELSTLVNSTQVRRLPPPPPPVKEGMPPIPTPPPTPGVDPGTALVVRETLTSDARVTAKAPEPKQAQLPVPIDDAPRPFTAPPDIPAPRRYYYAVAVSPRGRYGPHSGLVPAPLGSTSGAPSPPKITVNEKSMTVKWEPPADARGAASTDPSLLPARSLVAGPPATTYDVYEVSREPTAGPSAEARSAKADAPLVIPSPINQSPLTATEFTQENITLGAERCFLVRPVDDAGGLQVRGPASAVSCASFADTFAPSPPRDLVAVAIPGAINLIWEGSEAKDVAGYVVLRGEAGGATLTPLMSAPVSGLTFRDETAKSGVRYVYAVVAVDKADNRSDESNRVEETAR
jgi:hypothetical protein